MPLERIGEHHWWRAAMVLLGTIGLATGFVRAAGFWSSYVLDIAGPAWNYILFRGLYSKSQPARLLPLFSPVVALVVIGSACVAIEAAQYFGLYEAHYDPYDFVAYFSLLVPVYAVDRWRSGHQNPVPTAIEDSR